MKASPKRTQADQAEAALAAALRDRLQEIAPEQREKLGDTTIAVHRAAAEMMSLIGPEAVVATLDLMSAIYQRRFTRQGRPPGSRTKAEEDAKARERFAQLRAEQPDATDHALLAQVADEIVAASGASRVSDNVRRRLTDALLNARVARAEEQKEAGLGTLHALDEDAMNDHLLGPVDVQDSPGCPVVTQAPRRRSVTGMDQARFGVSDAVWAKVASLLPGKATDPGATGRDNRLFLEAVLWRVRTEAPWRDLPNEFGRWNSVFQRFRRWVRAGVFDRLFERMSGEANFEYALIDGTIVSVHQKASGARGGLRIRPSAAREVG